MAEPTSRAGKIYLASLMRRIAKSHAKDVGLEGMKIGAVNIINKQRVKQILFLHFGSSFSYRPSTTVLVLTSYASLHPLWAHVGILFCGAPDYLPY